MLGIGHIKTIFKIKNTDNELIIYNDDNNVRFVALFL